MWAYSRSKGPLARSWSSRDPRKIGCARVRDVGGLQGQRRPERGPVRAEGQVVHGPGEDEGREQTRVAAVRRVVDVDGSRPAPVEVEEEAVAPSCEQPAAREVDRRDRLEGVVGAGTAERLHVDGVSRVRYVDNGDAVTGDVRAIADPGHVGVAAAATEGRGSDEGEPAAVALVRPSGLLVGEGHVALDAGLGVVERTAHRWSGGRAVSEPRRVDGRGDGGVEPRRRRLRGPGALLRLDGARVVQLGHQVHRRGPVGRQVERSARAFAGGADGDRSERYQREHRGDGRQRASMAWTRREHLVQVRSSVRALLPVEPSEPRSRASVGDEAGVAAALVRRARSLRLRARRRRGRAPPRAARVASP